MSTGLPNCGHLHPLNYTLGLAAVAEAAGVQIFEDSDVTRIDRADPATVATAAGREDIIVTTNDLGPDTALYVARGKIQAVGAQLPYDLGVAEANAALYALLGKPVAPYISIAAHGVNQTNLLAALELVTKRSPPPEVVEACAAKCTGITSR